MSSPSSLLHAVPCFAMPVVIGKYSFGDEYEEIIQKHLRKPTAGRLLPREEQDLDAKDALDPGFMWRKDETGLSESSRPINTQIHKKVT